ncbi:MAG: HD domain-containing protein [Planctomycetota bacterium]
MNTNLDLIRRSEVIETVLARHAEALGDDLEPYRGHIYRVLHYTRTLLDGDESDRATIDFALAEHDIALWSDRELAYLEPSIARAEKDAAELGRDVDLDAVRPIILYHHKFTSYRGPHATLVNAVRRADWCDATKGRIRKGIDAKLVERVREELPYLGFQDGLMRIAADLSGGSKTTTLRKLMRVYKA